MNPLRLVVSSSGAAMMLLLSGCASTQRMEELDTAGALVSQVETSPRAGVAAAEIAEARKSLDRANRLAESRGKREDIQFEAGIASKYAQIANEKILTAQARDAIEKGSAERQSVLVQAREREAQRAQAQADAAAQRASSLEQELADLKAKKTDRGLVVTLGDVLFDTARATLQPGAYATVDRLAAVLKEDPSRHVLIEGHTDSVGSDEYNQSLSERRAASVQAALFERGVASSQITAIGKGESTPVASNDGPGGRQQNRRVELIFQ